MAMQPRQIVQRLATRRVRKSLIRAIPVLGTAFAASHVVRSVRAKGARRGGFDAALDLTPIVGTVKAIYESFRGDLFPARASK